MIGQLRTLVTLLKVGELSDNHLLELLKDGIGFKILYICHMYEA